MSYELDLQRRGEATFEIDGGEYFQARIGPLGDPETLIEEQVPEGKHWLGTITLRLIETDE